MIEPVKHLVERSAPLKCRVPDNIPTPPRFKTIICDAPWDKNMCSRSGYGGAIKHYDLMSVERIKELPVDRLAAKDSHIYMWCLSSNVDQAIDVIRHWGYRFITTIKWVKPKMGCGNYWRSASELCVFGVKGKLPPLSKSEIDWFIAYPTGKNSEKPRLFISKVENVSPGPYLELFARRRPASNRSDYWCWGNEVEKSDYKSAGADIFIPGFPVPKYSFENTSTPVRGQGQISDTETSEGGKSK